MAIIIISLLPCSDETAISNDYQYSSVQLGDVQHTDAEENCLASCVCVCCGQRTLGAQLNEFQVQLLHPLVTNTVKNNKFLVQRMEYNIWQPPKMS